MNSTTSKKMDTPLFAASLLFVLVICEGDGASVTESFYSLCPQGFIASNSGNDFAGRSKLECLSACSETAGCSGVNLCPMDSGGMQCTLLAGTPATCDGLIPDGTGTCHYAKRAQTAPPGCQNGGTLLQNGTCLCPAGYRGTQCQSYIRDCSEAWDLGARSQSLDGVYVIQPTSSQSPFEVYCYFSEWSGETVLLWRQMTPPTECDVSWNTADWSYYVAGFGTAACKNFFVGLQKMQELTNQASYVLEILHLYDSYASSKSVYYTGFSLSNTTTNYNFQYSTCDSGSADNGMGELPPRPFCTYTNCVNNCYITTLEPGWYGNNCYGYSPFATTLTWLVNGTDVTCNEAVYAVARSGGYY